MKFLKEHFLFVLILVLCAVFRFIPLPDYQFTFDELSGLSRTFFNSFGDLIESGVKTTDTHPALVQILIFYLTKIFGYANWLVKLPFLLFSFGAIIYAYFFSLRNFSKQAAIFSAIIFSFSLIFVFYAPIARMYISGVFFSVALLFYFFEIFFLKQTKKINYFFFGLFALLSALNQHINALFAFTLCVSGFLLCPNPSPKERGAVSPFKNYIITCLIIVVCYLPHLPVTLYQLNVGGIGFEQGGWLPKPAPDAIFSFLKVLFGTGKSYLVLAALIVLSMVLNKKINFQKQQWLLLILFLFNYFIVYFYSIYRAPVFQNSVMLFSGAGMVLFAASLINFKNNYVFYTAAFLLSFTLIYETYFKKEYYTQCVKTVYEQQFERTVHYKKLHGDKQVYPFFLDTEEAMLKLYFSKYRSNFDYKTSFDTAVSSMKKFSRFVASLNGDYVVLASAFPAQQAVVKEHFPYLIENTQTQAINLKVYSKRQSDSALVVKDDEILKYSTVIDPQNFNYPKSEKMQAQRKIFSLPLNPSEEFPFDAIAKYSDVVSHEGQMLLVKAKFRLPNTNENSIESCIVVHDPNKDITYGYAAKAISDFVMKQDSTLTVYTDNFFGTNHRYIKDKSNIHCYLWNRNKDNAIMLDYDIQLIDFCKNKWQFWE